MTEDSTPTDLEKSLGVEYVNPAYPQGDPLRYGMEWDAPAKRMAERVRLVSGVQGDATQHQTQEPKE